MGSPGQPDGNAPPPANAGDVQASRTRNSRRMSSGLPRPVRSGKDWIAAAVPHDIENRMHVDPFRIAVPVAPLADLRERLARPRFPDEIADSGWTYGSNLAYVKELVAYWRDRYDWRRHEAALNAFPQFRARVGDL